jgi:integrase
MAIEWAEKRHAHLMTHGKEKLPSADAQRSSVAALIEGWLAARGDVPSAPEDRQRLNDYVVPLIGRMLAVELRPKDVVAMLEKLKLRPSRKGGLLASSTIRSTFALVRQVFDWAVLNEHVPANPVVVQNGVVPPKKDKDPTWRGRARFSREESEGLITDPRIPLQRRVSYAIALLTGLRVGEASALTWEDYEAQGEPLGKLVCCLSYNTRQKRAKGTKTGVPREIPVHPVLAQILNDWRIRGWKTTYGKSPKRGDLIVPSTEGGYRSANYALKTFHRDLALLGLRVRRLHDCRRTFVSLAQDGGASKEVLRAITHPSPRDAFDLYSTPSWVARCEAVLCLKIGARVDAELVASPVSAA